MVIEWITWQTTTSIKGALRGQSLLGYFFAQESEAEIKKDELSRESGQKAVNQWRRLVSSPFFALWLERDNENAGGYKRGKSWRKEWTEVENDFVGNLWLDGFHQAKHEQKNMKSERKAGELRRSRTKPPLMSTASSVGAPFNNRIRKWGTKVIKTARTSRLIEGIIMCMWSVWGLRENQNQNFPRLCALG